MLCMMECMVGCDSECMDEALYSDGIANWGQVTNYFVTW